MEIKKYNPYGIPEVALEKIRKRDRKCVYCKKEMFVPSKKVPRSRWATIEHFNIVPPWNNPKTIAICCFSCNASRGIKPLKKWFGSNYCLERKINEETVLSPVKIYLKRLHKH